MQVSVATPLLQAHNITVHQEDCGEAPHIRHFYGRKREMALLHQWLLVDSCRLITVFGMGGLGKTTLVTHFAEQAKEAFTHIFWRSLHNAPSLEDILSSYLQFFSGHSRTELPQAVEDQLSLLIDSFRQYRCLVILDNVESVLQEGGSAGRYRAGYEDYGRLLQRVGETQHRSCLLLTSREKPYEVAYLEGSDSPVRSLQMIGVGTEEGRELLQDSGLFGDDVAWATLIARYSGNPLALKLVAEPIHEVFGGDIAHFLQEGESVFGDIHTHFDQQFRRLSPLEQKILYWLAIERTPTPFEELQAEIIPAVQKGALLEALTSLRRRSMVEISGSARFALQAVIVEYITDEIVKQIYKEIQTEQLELFACLALMKAHSRDDVRNSQSRFLLTPLLQRLLTQWGKEGMEKKLGHILDLLRDTPIYTNSYATGNILNLLVLARCNLCRFDFSRLTVRQAYLQNVLLTDVNFAYADLVSSVFTDTFSGVLSTTFSPDGNRLVVGTANGEIRIWQAATGKPLFLCQGHTDAVWSVTFSSDGILLASGSQDQTIRIWDSNTGQCLRVLQQQGIRIWSVAFNKDGKQLVSAGDDQLLHVWDTDTGERIHTFAGHTHRIRAVAWNPAMNLLASAGEDQTIRIWEANTGSCLHILQGHTASLQAVVFRSDGKLIASAGDDQTMRLWDVDTGQCLKTLTGHTNWVRSLAFSTNGSQLASGSDDQTVRLWDVDTGQCLKTMQRHMNCVWSVAFRPNSSILASGSDDQTIHVWDVHSGYDLYTLYGYTTWIWSVALHPGGQLLASSDQAIHLWDIKAQRSVQTLQGHTNRVRAVAFSPDGKTLASASEDQTVRLWNTHTGKALHTLMGHTNWVRIVAFHPNGHLLASGSDDQSVRLWNSNTGQCLRILQGHTLRNPHACLQP